MTNKTIVIYGGRFQPFHIGHYEIYKNIVSKFKNADVYIATSDKVDYPKSPFSFAEKKLIMVKMFDIAPNRIVQVKNPYKPDEILSNYNSETDILITILGDKDQGRLGGKYYKPYTASTEMLPFKEHGYVYYAKNSKTNISGTEVRNKLSTPDDSAAIKIFNTIYPKYDKTIYDLLRSKLKLNERVDIRQMYSVEDFADSELSPVDVDLGKETDHFFQRLNDPRNSKPISHAELIGFFKRLAKRKNMLKQFMQKYDEFVISDRATQMHIPFINATDSLIAKTIIRKNTFRTPNPILKVENKNLIHSIILNEPVEPTNIDEEVQYMKNSLNISRAEMPQITSKDIPEYIQYLKKQGVRVSTARIPVANLSPTQADLNVDKVKAMLTAPKEVLAKPVIVSKDNYILDGHHRVMALYNIDKTFVLKCLKVSVGIRELLELSKSYPKVNYKKIEEAIYSKSRNIVNTKSHLLLNGGAYGHMAHPFDVDMNLSFKDLKQIVTNALNGDLELAREKTDGQALAISWKNGSLIAARNKGHLANSGENAMSESDVISKFSGRGSISDAFAFAIRDLRTAISQLPPKERAAIFKEGKVFANCEIIYPENTNVIPYNQSLLVFHGTMEYDERGNPIREDAQAGFKIADMIKSVNADVQEKFKLQGPPLQTLPKTEDLSKRQPYYLSKIAKLQQEFNLNDTDGVADYHSAWWNRWIVENAPEPVGDELKQALVNRWAFNDKSFRLNRIKSDTVRSWAETVEKTNHQKISKTNLMKFEDIFLGVGAEVLSFMTSVLVVNPSKSRQDIINKLETAISDIKATGDARNVAKLELELKRLQSLGGFSKIVPNEGIVFNYNGKTYKLTGAFAPLNQILGIFNYTR